MLPRDFAPGERLCRCGNCNHLLVAREGDGCPRCRQGSMSPPGPRVVGRIVERGTRRLGVINGGR